MTIVLRKLVMMLCARGRVLEEVPLKEAIRHDLAVDTVTR
jgi:hypothetical protein